MRIAIMGTGAVGGYFGAKLAATGNDVVFIARGQHLQAMRYNGLRVRSPQGDLHIRQSSFIGCPTEASPVDLVLFCVKSYDTEACVRKLGPLIGPGTMILSLQNGVDNPEKIARLWGTEKTLAGVVYLGAEVSSPGTITHSAAGRIVFGALEGKPTERLSAVQEVLSGAQIPSEISSEIGKVQWIKLLWNAPFCAIASLTRATVRDILDSESLTKLVIDCMEEVREAAKIQGFEIAAGTIEQTLAFSRSLGGFKPSMLQDLEADKPLEYEAFNGIVVNLLRHAGKQAPTNQVFYGTLKYLDERIREKSSRAS